MRGTNSDDLDARLDHAAAREERHGIAVAPEPLLREAPLPAPYPVASLGPLREAAQAIAWLTQAPPAIAAQSVLGAAALAVQGHADVATLGGVRPCALYLLTVAQSGERKSGCDRLAMQAVRTHERELADIYRTERRDADAAREVWAKQKAGIIAGMGRKDSPTSPLVAEDELRALGEEPPAPLLPSLTVTDPTLEGLTKNVPVLRPTPRSS